MGLRHYLKLLRVSQWYKNLVVFLALFFSGNGTDAEYVITTIIAFFSLCLISSGNYVINDLIDLKRDRLHPEKKYRMLPSGKVRIFAAIVLAVLSLLMGFAIAVTLSTQFLVATVWLFLLTLAYSLWLKQVLFADILTIGTLFVIRAMAGAFVIDVQVSPWLILCPFFLSLFLSVGKRHSEVHLLGEKAGATRRVLLEYTPDLTTSLMVISTTLLIISYALYSFLSEHANLIYTLPFALFVIFRFYYLITSGNVIGRQAQKFIFDRPLVAGLLLWAIVTAVVLYG